MRGGVHAQRRDVGARFKNVTPGYGWALGSIAVAEYHDYTKVLRPRVDIREIRIAGRGVERRHPRAHGHAREEPPGKGERIAELKSNAVTAIHAPRAKSVTKFDDFFE